MLLGIAHAALSFKKYESFSAEAFWFFSAGLALLFAGIPYQYTPVHFYSAISYKSTYADNFFSCFLFGIAKYIYKNEE